MVSRCVLRVAQEHWAKLTAYHFAAGKNYEALSFMWGRASKVNNLLLVTVPHNAPIFLLAQDCFITQSDGYLKLRASVQAGLSMEFARSDFNTLVNIHDHNKILMPTFSGTDDRDDLLQDRWLRTHFEPMLRHEADLHHRHIYNLSIVLAQNGVDARLTDIRLRDEEFTSIPQIEVIGDSYRCIQTTAGQQRPGKPGGDEVFLRQRDFIALSEQKALSKMTVAVVGAGGLGSTTCEALARIGVGGLDIIDHDTLTATNLNRWQGGKPIDLGKPKSRLLARKLRQMFPQLRVRAIPFSVYERRVERVLSSANAIVATVDNSPARYFLNRASIQHMVPYFDGGVAIRTADGVDFLTRYFSVIPGVTACTECIPHYELLDREAVTNFFMDERTASERKAAGYVIDAPDVAAPSVYALNLRAAGLLTTEFLNWVCSWRPPATAISEHWQTGKFERADRENFPCTPATNCPTCSYYLGLGFSEPLPRPRAFRTNSAQGRKPELSSASISQGETHGKPETKRFH